MAQCHVCGANVSDRDNICSDCGTDLRNRAAGGTSPGASSYTPTPSFPAPREYSETPLAATDYPPPASEPQSVSSVSSPPASAIGHQSQLTLKRGGGPTSEVFQISGRVVVGRFDADSGPVEIDLTALPEAVHISRRHAEIWCDDSGQWFVKDLGSRNGTFVRVGEQGSFQRVSDSHPINAGDEVSLGNARFEFATIS